MRILNNNNKNWKISQKKNPNFSKSFIFEKFSGTVNYSALNRDFLWLLCRDVITFFLPIIDRLGRILQFRFFNNFFIQTVSDGIICSHCKRKAILPVRDNICGHINCYYCYQVITSCTMCGTNLNKNNFRFLQNESNSRIDASDAAII